MARTTKIFQLAKEINLGSGTIIEFLQERGYEVLRKHMSPLNEEMVEEVIKKFDHDKWNKLIEQRQREKEEEKRREEERLREEQLAKILHERREKKKGVTREITEKEKAEKAKPTIPVTTKPRAVKEGKPVIGMEVEPAKISPPTPTTPPAAKPESQKPLVEKKPKLKPKPKEEKEEEKPHPKRKRKKRWLKRRKRDEKYRAEVLAGPQRLPRRKRRRKRKEILPAEVDAAIKETMASLLGRRKVKRRKKKTKTGEIVEEQVNVIETTEFISTADLANLLDVGVQDFIKKCLEMGQLLTINQRLDKDLIVLLAAEYGYEVEFLSDFFEEEMAATERAMGDVNLQLRPPVVTIMGHVDHGKTSLLDHIRQSNIVAGESGGITQHIGAYEITHNGEHITFLDTPGHEAFTAMRARGAQITDIVVLVVAADDKVMPQTLEAIDHARAAVVPIIVAINKIDKANADVEGTKKQLADHNVLIEEWGGKIQAIEISAKLGTGVDTLLEKISLEAELMELKANPDSRAQGVVLEGKLERGRGPIATLLVQEGTLHIGDNLVAGSHFGKVRAMFNERGNLKKEASPSTPVQILGFNGTPQAGDRFFVLEDEKQAKELTLRRQQIRREQDLKQVKFVTLDQISDRIRHGEVKELPLIIKADADGSIEALSDALMKIPNEDVSLQIIHKGVGAISESDVLLASASRAIILGFHVRPNAKARELAKKEKVDMRLYKVIYEAISEIRDALEGLLEPERTEEILGSLEVRETYRISQIGTVAGCYVKVGKVSRKYRVRLIRDDVGVYDGSIATLKRFKDDAKEVKEGLECGLTLENYNDIKVGDVLEVYQIQHKKRTLD
ncbi:translation initiation factor IF-2 [candidate division KSB1 bacterium]|nr:translation initiation factor IF-2 [candidate division KSB1 bacterium]